MSFLHKIFGDPNVKSHIKFEDIVAKVNGKEPVFEKLSNEEVRAKTQEFRERLGKGETLDSLMPEAFAAVREAAKRTLGMRHYDVQLIGGAVLHFGHIAEMRTGEGKTLVATLPTYLNALEGKGVHVVTVNDYLAKRDAVWMGQIYDFLGLSVGIIQNQRVSFIYDPTLSPKVAPGKLPESQNTDVDGEVDMERDAVGSFKVEEEHLRPVTRQEAYRCDITYGTNNEFGFDYLRDNMVQDLKEMVMRPGDEMHYAIVDEVDSILIDEARTPLIISAPAQEATQQYYQFANLVKRLVPQEDYNVDEKLRSATLTESGISKFEQWLGVKNIYEEGGIRLIHHIEQALKAEVLFHKDKEYVVEGDQIIIIDEFTGRKMPGRRYNEGLHQAIEAKEGAPIQKESQTLATITFQNLFRLYRKLAGMTGTAVTEAEEFVKIYNLDVVAVPTNKKDRRKDNSDRIYKTEQGKFAAVVEKVKECRKMNQPILIGTISVDKNEQLSAFLVANGIPHEVLNAKNHEREGEIIAQAGRPGAVTLATNMAGRGVDIKLGGTPINKEEEQKVIEAGGLFVLGTERHESRRIDNQLRGRAARQGDPGETQFFVSTEDDLMRIFAGDRIRAVMSRLNVPDDMPIEQKMITRMLETAQKKVESHNFDIRKHLLEYDDVLNKHRQVIYQRRREILEVAADRPTEKYKTTRDIILDMIEDEIEFVVSYHTNTEDRMDWNMQEIYETMRTIFPLSEEQKTTLLSMNARGENKLEDVECREKLVQYLLELTKIAYENIEQNAQTAQATYSTPALMRELEKGVLLRSFDTLWVDHLVAIDHLRTGIGLQGYGQRDPLVEYKKESYRLFNELLANLQKEVVYTFFKVNIGIQLAPSIMSSDKMTLAGATKELSAQGEHIDTKPRTDDGEKVGRNDPCPCGAVGPDGKRKKYKRCHGR